MGDAITTTRRRAALLISGVVLLIGAVVGGILMWSAAATLATPVAIPTPDHTPAPLIAATPLESAEYPENPVDYELAGLPQVDVFAVQPALQVDSDPTASLPGITARASAASIPVFADPTGDPVATLPRDHPFDGTTVAVIEQQTHWAQVLLTGRSTAPSTGQLTGWVRAQDVAFGAVTDAINVDLAARTIDIVRADGSRERIAEDFGSGTADAPTPTGRSFLMLIRSEPSLEYTRGHPIVYLSAQSPTLEGFDGLSVAVTAFHYHDTRSGAVSNGCIRLDATAIDRLALFPEGTPVFIR